MHGDADMIPASCASRVHTKKTALHIFLHRKKVRWHLSVASRALGFGLHAMGWVSILPCGRRSIMTKTWLACARVGSSFSRTLK